MGVRSCTICAKEIDSKEERNVLALQWKYYENYVRDLGDPTQRRGHVWCPDCTDGFIKWLRERLDDRPREMVT